MEEYNYEVATQFEDTTKHFHSLIQALEYFDSLNEEAALWYYAGESSEMIKHKF